MGLCLELCVYVIIYVSIYSDLHTTFYVLYGSLYIGSLYSHLYYIHVCYAQSTDSDHPRILLPKPRIRALRNIPRIAHANLGSEDLLRKPRIRMQSSRIAQPNLGHPRQQTHDRSRTQSSLAIHGNVGSLQRMAKLLCVRDRSWLLLCRGWPNCFACTIDRGFVDADDRAALRARSIVGLLPRMAKVWLRVAADGRGLVACCRGWPRFGCAIPEDCVRADPRFSLQKAALRARSIVGLLPQMAEVWLRDPRRLRVDPGFACVILGLLGKSSVRGLRSKILGWSESVLCA